MQDDISSIPSVYDLPDDEQERLVANAQAIAAADRVVCQPAREAILTCLHDRGGRGAMWNELMRLSDLTTGKAQYHLRRLEEAGYIHAHKHFVGKKPATTLYITALGERMLHDTHRRRNLFVGRGRGQLRAD